MIRFALRQFRTEAIVTFVALAAVAILLAITGAHLAQVNNTFLSTCKATGDCATATNPVVNLDKQLQTTLPLIVVIAPALIGLFFGAPLIARELETGTFRLAWTQSVTQKRWLVVKCAVVGVAAMAIGGLLTWMANWWASPLDAVNQDRFGLVNFSFHGIAPIGYSAFAFALGMATGVLLRRTVAAMAVTAALFAAIRLAVTYWVRPNLDSPAHESLSLAGASASPAFGFNGPNGSGVALNSQGVTAGWGRAFGSGRVVVVPPHVVVPNGWVYSTAVVDKAGQAPTSQGVLHACPTLARFSNELAASGGRPLANGPGQGQFQACVDKLSATYHTLVIYQPASRFWPFQWAEMGIFLAAALALCGFTYWWLRRRYS